MRKKHNPKVAIIVGICLFVVISVVVINAHDMQTISRVKVNNQNIVISQGNTGITNTSIGLSNAGNVNNRASGINNTGGSFNNIDSGINSNQMNINNSGGSMNNVNAKFSDNGSLNNNNSSGISNSNNFSNTGNGFINEHGDFVNTDLGFENQGFSNDANKYRYQNIDWSTWKSNFVNRILDDSMYISSLDNYGLGTWFYYSFQVTDTGEIKDVMVFSLYLSEEDKKLVRDLIRSYAHQPITIFPKDSRRKKAKVKAIMLLGDTESKSNASNFNDVEKIKIKY